MYGMKTKTMPAATLGVLGMALTMTSTAAPLPGGTQDPTQIPKYVTPLVIPPVMSKAPGATGNDYDIAVRQFKQQILPGGIWNTINGRKDNFPATPVWSYGPAADPTPAVAPDPASQFNYPAYTVENTVNTDTTVDWINDLVVNPDVCKTLPAGTKDKSCNYLSHLLPIDRSLHWANPEQLPCMNPAKTKDCRPDPVANAKILQVPYSGPVPIVTHVHGAHVGPESDGYPEAWWLPNANNIPAGYATTGTLVNQYGTMTNTPGVGSFSYPNDQPSTTLWYHDHTLGMTRNNVYAGPAGFWLIRDPDAPGGETGLAANDSNGNPQALPSPAPVYGESVVTTNFPASLGGAREKYREIPIVIQDRSFNSDGSLFYPDNRAFFEGINQGRLNIPFSGDKKILSDIAPIWNPEAFFNTIVVNGVSWPTLQVEPDLYRFRLLNGCNSRFLNLSLQALDAAGAVLGEVPFYQIGAEQSLLPAVVKIVRGDRAVLPADGSNPDLTPAPLPNFAALPPDPAAAETVAGLLMGLAERADVLVDFSNLPAGTARVRMINTAPDAPFGGFPDFPADPATTGQVMEFALVADTAAGEGFTAPQNLKLSLPDHTDPANVPTSVGTPRSLALIEEESLYICVTIAPNGVIKYDARAIPDPKNPGTCVVAAGLPGAGTLAMSFPFAPKAAVLGINGSSGGSVTLWSDPIATNPAVGDTETWELWNWTVDGHPIHLHLVKFKVINREAFDPVDGTLSGVVNPPEATEAGWKDTVIAYPGEVTRVNATFDIAGLYVWHCHIVEHEDNEMMVPYCVGDKASAPGCNVVP
jgi:FtsP/CotA-like multicopper oxidase with cupredoxin domain